MASLNDTWAALKGAGATSLDQVVVDGYKRTLAGSGLARASLFQVEAGHAPDPDTEVAPFSLDDWTNYAHGSLPQRGGDLAKAGAYAALDLTWTLPSGYTRAPGLVRQLLYYKLMGTSEDLNVNPFVSPIAIIDVGDATSYTLEPLSEGSWYAIGIKQEFDDSDDVYLPADADAYAHATGETALLGAGAGISSGEILAPAPTINGISQVPSDPSQCQIGDTIEIRVNVTMEGPSQGTLAENVNSTGWSVVSSTVAAGTNGNISLNRQSGNNYAYRLRYNGVSPVQWSNVMDWDLECTNL